MAMRWYVVQAYAQHESGVVKALKERITRHNLQEQFGEILVPTEEVVEVKDGVKRTTERKFYPGYVYVQMEMNEDTWHLVKSTQRVLGFIGGTAEKPAPVPDRQMDTVIGRVQAAVDKPKPKTLYEPGQQVRVTEGPFADFTGVVEEINYEKSRLRVAVLIFGRPTPVELEFSQVEKT